MPLLPIGAHSDLVMMKDFQRFGCHHLFQAIHNVSDVLIEFIRLVIEIDEEHAKLVMESNTTKPLLALTHARLGVAIVAGDLNASPLIVERPQMEKARQIFGVAANIRDQFGPAMRTGIDKGTYAAILAPNKKNGNACVIQCAIVTDMGKLAFMAS